MAGLINWRKVAIPGSNPDSDHVFVGIDDADGQIYVKDDLGVVTKFPTGTGVDAQIDAKLVDYDLSTVVDSKIATAVAGVSVEIPLAQTVFVAKNGVDLGSTGQLDQPFLTIKAALDYVTTQSPTSSTPWAVEVGPGVYAEDPMTCPSEVYISGKGERTVITPNNPSVDLLTIAEATSLRDLRFQGVTGASAWAVKLSSTSGSGASVANLFFFFNSNDLTVESTVATFIVTATNISSLLCSGTSLHNGGNTRLTIQGGQLQGNTTTTIGTDVSGDGIAFLYNLRAIDCNVGIRSTGTNEVDIFSYEGTASNIPLQVTSTAKIIVNGADIIARDAVFTDINNIVGYFTNRGGAEDQFRLTEDLSVGTPGAGKESAMGEGEAYESGMLVYQFDGSTFTNVSSEAQANASTFGFPNTAVNSAIYVASAFPAATAIKIPGLRVDVDTAAVKGAGDIVAEYWNGSSWVEFNHLSTENFGEFLPFAKQVFERAEINHIRFDPSIDPLWQTNDPVSLGTNFHWMRWRITGASITTAPIFNNFRLHTNSTEVAEDGFIEHFGFARTVSILPFDIGSFQAANNSPGNQDVYVGDNMGVGRIENNFQAGTVDRVGLVRPFPLDIDTSAAVKLIVYFMTSGNDTTPNFSFVVRWTNTGEGDPIYDATASAPTTALREQQVTVSVPNAGTDQQQSFEAMLDVSDIIARRASGPGDLFWLSIERQNDGNADDVRFVQIKVEYVEVAEGGHI